MSAEIFVILPSADLVEVKDTDLVEAATTVFAGHEGLRLGADEQVLHAVEAALVLLTRVESNRHAWLEKEDTTRPATARKRHGRIDAPTIYGTRGSVL